MQKVLAILFFLHASYASQTIHIVFSCHLDIGFDGITPYVGFDNTVINTYFDVYFPKAVRGRYVMAATDDLLTNNLHVQIRVAEELRQRGGQYKLKFMTHVRARTVAPFFTTTTHNSTTNTGIPGVTVPGLPTRHRCTLPKCTGHCST